MLDSIDFEDLYNRLPSKREITSQVILNCLDIDFDNDDIDQLLNKIEQIIETLADLGLVEKRQVLVTMGDASSWMPGWIKVDR